jgi:alpha-N-arabinofuranosidase
LVSGAGPDPNGELFDFAWNKLRGLQADIIDEHYYRAPEWFLQNASRYNNYDRKGPKVFAGEYAAQSVAICSPDNKNNWKCAMSEAAFMTGLERNAGVVYMASYAPLFAHTEAWQWTPNLIWFDNLNSYGTPNYYVQKMFATNKGNFVVPALKNGMVIDGKDSLYCSATINKNPNEIIIKMVNIASKPTDVKILPEGVKSIDNDAILQVLASKDLNIVNSIANPKAIAPGETKVKLNGKQVKISLDAYSFSVLKINFRE